MIIELFKTVLHIAFAVLYFLGFKENKKEYTIAALGVSCLNLGISIGQLAGRIEDRGESCGCCCSCDEE